MQYYVTKRIGSMMLITLLLIAIMFSAAVPSYAATVKTIPSTSTIVAKANKLKLSKDNYSLTWNITNHKVKTGKNSEKLLCIHDARKLRVKYKPFYREYCKSLWKETDDEKD